MGCGVLHSGRGRLRGPDPSHRRRRMGCGVLDPDSSRSTMARHDLQWPDERGDPWKQHVHLSLSLTQIPSVALIGEKWKMVIQEFAVDLNKPLVFQVGHLEEHYQEWVHQPIVSKEGPHFFANDTMEFLTRTKWWAVPVIWLPAVCWLFAKSIRMGHTIQEVILMALFEVFVWTLIEYSLHRFLFHIERKSY